ncbi:Ribonuclease J 1 [Aliiroseovarius sp. xm-m-379]|uniref:ribonuclease J n=1 Tax=unclassified Aliiroseovarius TaxID=2623558 RepID=UPI001569C5B0|nr:MULTISPECIES: ribonuclease J [unclassified Aliiroseovarius]NRP12295.1 Ribonuclease J 1 [Aliiroseovarius sp. xm-d-517]NRP24669.1 Ribonuclease J 1 [Aliiroseovarius sp. xm-m-379]NRP30697.1 Ribonuclease J 1 [Aliiroseovarius sp. xm-m-314]NRP33468.1 Ribonuclease J 1 [Aliiroseovarius sp. xm-a-104]NRP40575.1 Ribonuclease J 1 [Aliiroseovarius sp. xm-m-339-2]
MTSDRLIYLPLGGAGEIGMNAYVYGYGKPGKERLILVDLGVTFPDMDSTPGVNLIMPDVSWLEANADRLDAIFITHAHEDHVGAVGRLYSKLKAPIHARPFTRHHAQRKLEEAGQVPEVVIAAGVYPQVIEAGPFKVSFLPLSHSIPESSGLVIDTPAGRVVHTGDFKLDPTPVLGDPFDEELWREVAKPGVKALVCDSTNVFSHHEGRTEASVGAPLRDLVKDAPHMVVATTFASNVARVKQLAEAGAAAGRSVCLLGRAMRRMIQAGVETGVLGDFPKTVTAEDARDIPRENLMLIVTGSQGERRAASAQLSRGKYLGMSLKEGDMFLFSSKTIPGNERGVGRIMNAFSEMAVDVIAESDLYHVSGHANRPDLLRTHEIFDPQMVIPMHGEHRHLREHAKLAQEHGRSAMVVVNGAVCDLTGDAPHVVEHVEADRIYLDGDILIGALDGIVRDRIRLALNGHVIVNVIVENDEPLGEPWVEIMGLPELGHSRAPLVDVLEEDLGQFLMRAGGKTLRDDDKLGEELKRIARKTTNDEIGRKPEVTVVVSRLEG